MGAQAAWSMDNNRASATAFQRPAPAEITRSARRSHHDVEATKAERAAIARAFGLVALERLRLRATLSPDGREDWRLEGVLEAAGAQACVATLEPTPFAFEAPVLRLWSERAEPPDPLAAVAFDSESGDLSDDEEVEPLPDPIDLGAVALEALSLALDPYPRAADAPERAEAWAGPPDDGPVDASRLKPFAGLAELKARVGDGASDDGAAPQGGAEPEDEDGR